MYKKLVLGLALVLMSGNVMAEEIQTFAVQRQKIAVGLMKMVNLQLPVMGR